MTTPCIKLDAGGRLRLLEKIHTATLIRSCRPMRSTLEFNRMRCDRELLIDNQAVRTNCGLGQRFFRFVRKLSVRCGGHVMADVSRVTVKLFQAFERSFFAANGSR